MRSREGKCVGACDTGTRRDFLVGGASALALTCCVRHGAHSDGKAGAPSTRPTASADAELPGEIAAAKGLCFGSALSIQPLRHDQRYAMINARLSNMLVHGSAFQWHELERSPGAAYNFDDVRTLLEWGASHHKPFRGHMLVDWAGIPKWVAPRVEAASLVDAERMLREHISRILRAFPNQFVQWNVINEPVDGFGMRKKHVWYRKLGEAYVDIAFDEATKWTTGVSLAINQDQVEMDSRYQRRCREELLELLIRMKQRGVPIHSVGVEGHLKSDSKVDQDGLHAFLRDLESLDLSFMITEFDVDDRSFAQDVHKRDADVAALARDFLDVTLPQPRCEGLICWGFLDRYHWIVRRRDRQREDGAPQRPTLFDDAYMPKPIYDVTVAALRRVSGPGRYSILPESHGA